MSRRRRTITLEPSDFGSARANRGYDCLIAVALAREYGGRWSAGGASATQEGSGRKLSLGWDARRAMARFDMTGTSTASRRPVTVTVYESTRGRRSRAPVKAGVAGGALLLASFGDMWWAALLTAGGIGIAVTAAVMIVSRTAGGRGGGTTVRRMSQEPGYHAVRQPGRSWPEAGSYKPPGMRTRGTGQP